MDLWYYEKVNHSHYRKTTHPGTVGSIDNSLPLFMKLKTIFILGNGSISVVTQHPHMNISLIMLTPEIALNKVSVLLSYSKNSAWKNISFYK